MSKIMDLLNSLESETGAHGEPPAVTPGAQPIAAPVARLRALAGHFTDRYGLRENPFGDTVGLEYYFKSAAHEEAYLRLAATVRDGIALGLVTGPSGAGKTIVSQLLLQGLDRGAAQVVLALVTPEMSRMALLRELLREAGVTEMPARSRDLLELLHELMLALQREGKRLVVIIDEAHFLSSEALHVLRTLSNLESPGAKLCTCLLFAESRFLRRLEHPVHSSLATRIFHRIALRPLTEEETSQYLTFRLLVGGGRPELFDDGSRRAIFAASGGVCRNINRLAYLALDAGWRRGCERITADLVETS
jgi:type II secretory pathway predicted ATPase ExeA